jgi:hypothetical protein
MNTFFSAWWSYLTEANRFIAYGMATYFALWLVNMLFPFQRMGQLTRQQAWHIAQHRLGAAMSPPQQPAAVSYDVATVQWRLQTAERGANQANALLNQAQFALTQRANEAELVRGQLNKLLSEHRRLTEGCRQREEELRGLRVSLSQVAGERAQLSAQLHQAYEEVAALQTHINALAQQRRTTVSGDSTP